jgi:hypothetical protein
MARYRSVYVWDLAARSEELDVGWRVDVCVDIYYHLGVDCHDRSLLISLLGYGVYSDWKLAEVKDIEGDWLGFPPMVVAYGRIFLVAAPNHVPTSL